MIASLAMENFKAFEKEFFQLGRLNILAGLNNAGKSSVIQALRLIEEQKPLPDMGPLEGYIRRDSGGFVLWCDCDGSMIEVSCERENPAAVAVRYGKRGEIEIEFPHAGNKTVNLGVLISYISADRLGPRNSLPLNIDGFTTTVGSKGENIVDFLSNLDGHWDGLRVPPLLVAKEGMGIQENVKEWLRVISPGVDFRYESDRRTDIGRTEFNGYRPVHVGFGLSYTLPIIASILIHAALLSAGRTSPALILIENPEAHLHPSGQTKMGELMALASACGLQIVAETHSDHLLNGVRIAVKEGKLSCSDVKCFFFMADNSDEPACVERISIDRFGMLDHWPRGFFDESEKNLLRLL
jgi:predicted ATPase